MDPDALLKSEINEWRNLHRMHKGAKVPASVIASSKRTVEFLEELLELRQKIRGMVNRLEEKTGVTV